MTKNDVFLMLVSGGLAKQFADVDKGFEIIEGKLPEAYLAPQWLFEVLELLQGEPPKWAGRRLDPWAKDEIRGQ